MDPIERYNRGNAFGLENNLELEVIEPGHIRYTMKVEKKHFATPELVHGGALAGFMDAVLSLAAFSAVKDEGKVVATVEFKINYLKAVKRECTLTGLGKVIKKGKQIIVVNGEILDGEGSLVATGTGSIMPLNAGT